jgi:hypothetical protein
MINCGLKISNARPSCCFIDSLASSSHPAGKVDEICTNLGDYDAEFISYFCDFFV